jgi:hypothetical protein
VECAESWEEATLARREGWWRSGTGIVAGIAVGTVVVHLATGWRYGFDRDELMAVEDARHLAWGYVQYPPVTAFFGRVALLLFGKSLVGFRLFAAVAQAAAVVLTGLMAKELGGGKWAQVTAALAGVPFCLGGGALMQYISFDYVCWVWVAYCMVRVLGGRVAGGIQGTGIRASATKGGPEEREKEVEECKSARVKEGAKTQAQSVGMGNPQRCGEEENRKAEEGRQERQEEGNCVSVAEEPKSTVTSDSATDAADGSKDPPLHGSGDARWWVGVGAGIGLGMMAKYTMGFLAAGVVVGVLFEEIANRKWKFENGNSKIKEPKSGPPSFADQGKPCIAQGKQKAAPTGESHLKRGWLWLGVVAAAGIFLPNLIWEWKRGFVSLDFLKFLHERDVAAGLTDWFLLGQLEVTLLAMPLALAGLWFCFGGERRLADSPGRSKVRPLHGEDEKRYRVLGWMYAVPLVLFLLMRGRNYYLAPGYPMLYAAGCVWVEKKLRVASGERKEKEVEECKSARAKERPKTQVRDARMAYPGEEEEDNAETQRAPRFAEKKSENGKSIENRKSEGRTQEADREVGVAGMEEPKSTVRSDCATDAADGSKDPPLHYRKGRWIAAAIWAGLILDVVVAGAVALPIAPVNTRWWKFAVRVDSVFAEEIGWPEFVESVAGVRDRFPAGQRARVGILAGNYGELGALNFYGEKYGLPRAISGVNSSWERGYGSPAPETVIVTGYSRELLEKHFASCEVGARTWYRFGVMNEETIEDPEIFVCRGLKESWEEFWKRIRKFA